MAIKPIVGITPSHHIEWHYDLARFGGQSSLHKINWPFVFNANRPYIFLGIVTSWV